MEENNFRYPELASSCRAGKSNSGEGGEDPVRWDVMQNVDADGVSPSLPHLKGLQNGDMATSRIKQVRRSYGRSLLPCRECAL